MRRVWLAMIIVAVLAVACGGSDSDTEATAGDGNGSSTSDSGGDGVDASTDEPAGDAADESADESDDGEPADEEPADEEPDPDFSGSGSGDFCATAREYEENDPLEDLSFFDGQAFFDAADELWNGILPDVPDEIRPDVEVIIDNFRQMRELGEKYDYDFFDEELSAEMEAIDQTGMEEATARFDAYLEDVCGITSVDTSGDGIGGDDIEIDPDQLGTSAEIVAQIFNLDLETAECLVDELGDLNDPSAIDFSRLDEPICGTTLNEVLAGMGQ